MSEQINLRPMPLRSNHTGSLLAPQRTASFVVPGYSYNNNNNNQAPQLHRSSSHVQSLSYNQQFQNPMTKYKDFGANRTKVRKRRESKASNSSVLPSLPDGYVLPRLVSTKLGNGYSIQSQPLLASSSFSSNHSYNSQQPTTLNPMPTSNIKHHKSFTTHNSNSVQQHNLINRTNSMQHSSSSQNFNSLQNSSAAQHPSSLQQPNSGYNNNSLQHPNALQQSNSHQHSNSMQHINSLQHSNSVQYPNHPHFSSLQHSNSVKYPAVGNRTNSYQQVNNLHHSNSMLQTSSLQHSNSYLNKRPKFTKTVPFPKHNVLSQPQAQQHPHTASLEMPKPLHQMTNQFPQKHSSLQSLQPTQSYQILSQDHNRSSVPYQKFEDYNQHMSLSYPNLDQIPSQDSSTSSQPQLSSYPSNLQLVSSTSQLHSSVPPNPATSTNYTSATRLQPPEGGVYREPPMLNDKLFPRDAVWNEDGIGISGNIGPGNMSNGLTGTKGPHLQVRGLSYDQRSAKERSHLLDGISFEVKGGEILAIMATDGEYLNYCKKLVEILFSFDVCLKLNYIVHK